MPSRRVVITPSKIVFEFPSLSVPNRAIRMHQNINQNFLRVSFQTDDCNRGCYSSEEDPVLLHIAQVMDEGFKIGDKNFKFLHYSNSQIKSHSCWFMHESEELTYEDFIKTLGEFDKDTTISK